MAIKSLYPSILPSLTLDFANTKRLDPRITFTRTTTANYYDGKTVAKAEENLLLQSQTLDNASWTNTTVTVTANGATAPDGTSTAEVLTAAGANSTLLQTVTAVAGDYTFSVWLRRVTGTGNIDITTHSGGTWVTQTITSSWARYTVTQTLTAGSRTPGIRIVTSGDAVEAWGAQLEQRSSVTAYTATTTQPITNYIPQLLTAAAGQARFDHNPTTGESLGLLIEEQRANLLTYSAQFDDATWTKTRSSINANTIVAPDGTLTGDKLVEDTTASNNHHLQVVATVSNSTTYTFSCYIKAAGRSIVNIFMAQSTSPFTSHADAYIDLITGSITNGTATVTNVGNGWYRVSLTGTTTSTGETIRISTVSTGTTTSYTGDGYSGIYIWGAQLEAGAFPTSYIPTTTASVTRNADAASMTGTNFSSWYRADEGTLYAEAVSLPATVNAVFSVASISNNTNDNAFRLARAFSGITNRFEGEVRATVASQAYFNATEWAANTSGKVSLAYKVNDIAFSPNGVAVATDTSAILPVTDRIYLGSNSFGSGAFFNGTIKKFAFYPARLTNTQIQNLTA